MRRLGRYAAVWVAALTVLGCASGSGDTPEPAHGPEQGLVEVDPNSILLGENHAAGGAGGGAAHAGGTARGGASSASTPNPAIGKPCETSNDCPQGLSCRFDAPDYVGHKQCTLPCDAEATCLAAEKGSFCIGANICVHACTLAADCPAKTVCGNAGWCQRTGPGSGVPYCGGVATPCALLDDFGCSAALGCSDASRCNGSADSCYSQFDSFSCSSQDGCYWSSLSKSCSGSAHSCSSYSFDFECESQDGCHFAPRCIGSARSCSEVAVAVCENQPGCSTRTD